MDMRFLGVPLALLALLAATPAIAQPKAVVENGSSVKIEYTLKDAKGAVLDTNAGKDALAFTQGSQQIIPGLDKALLGMKVGDTKKVTVKPEDAYGNVDPKAEAEVPKTALPEGAAVVGTRLLARGQDGQPRPVTVKAVKDTTVLLDLNHPLAGKTLFFDVKIVTGWGVQWDIQWHVLIGRDTFWIPPHLMTYAGVTAVVALSFGMLAWDSWRGEGDVRVLGLTSSRGFHLAAWGIAVTILAAPIDDLWHRLFGIDVTLWSPPHLMGILGAVINGWACLVIAREVYAARTFGRPAAMVLAGAGLYGSLHLVIDPSFRIAYL